MMMNQNLVKRDCALDYKRFTRDYLIVRLKDRILAGYLFRVGLKTRELKVLCILSDKINYTSII